MGLQKITQLKLLQRSKLLPAQKKSNIGKGSGSRISCGKFDKWLSPAAAAPREEQRKRHSDCQGCFRFDCTNYNWKIPDARIAPIGDQSFLSTWSLRFATQSADSEKWIMLMQLAGAVADTFRAPPCSALKILVCFRWKSTRLVQVPPRNVENR